VITILRWTARFVSVALLVYFYFLGMSGFLKISNSSPFEITPLTLLLLNLLGLLVALRAEALGGVLGLVGGGGFYLLELRANGFDFLSPGLIGILLLVTPLLYLIAWWWERALQRMPKQL
jgi:hypothetical protein